MAWEVLKSYGVNHKLIKILKDVNENAEAAVRIQNELGSWFRTSKGTRQGDPISPQLFITNLQRAMDGVASNNTGFSIQGMRMNNLKIADYIVLLEENPEDPTGIVETLRTDCKPYGMMLNLSKTKTMVFGERNIEEKLNVTSYLRSRLQERSNFTTFQSKGCAYDLGDNLEEQRKISLMSKLDILRTCAFSSAQYACKTWVVTTEIQRRILAFERSCYRKVLRIGWRQRVRNEELYDRIHLREGNSAAKSYKKETAIYWTYLQDG